MAWNRRDDGCNDHPKIRALGSWEPDLLWQKAGVGCSKSATGGVIAPADLELYGFHAYLRTPAKVRNAAARIVEERLWHDHETVHTCPRCLDALMEVGVELQPGWYVFHDWIDCNPSRRAQDDEVTKFKEARAKQLRSMVALRDLVLARDRGLCRYCAVRVTYVKGDQRSTTRRVFDHVDPMGPNTSENVVVACGGCNGRKRDRTPQEAGMVLLDPPSAESIDANVSTELPRKPAEDSDAEPTDPPNGPSRDTRDGPGLVGRRSGVGRGVGLASVGSGLRSLVKPDEGCGATAGVGA